MDVVRSNIEKIGGSIEMKSVEGKGTTFVIKIPLTLAIVSSLSVGAGRERFAIPQITVSELVCVGENSAHKVEWVDNAPVLRLRGQLLPLVSLAKLLKLPSEDAINRVQYIVVTRVASFLFGLIVDQVFDMEEIVVKPVANNLKSLQIFSGNTILGDGRVIMILDPPGILKAAGMEQISEGDAQKTHEEKAQIKSGTENLLLLFNDMDGRLKAAPVDMVSRLEEIDLKSLETCDGHTVIQYLGQLMPVFGSQNDNQKDRRPLIIFQHDNKNAALMANKILDIATYYGDIRAPAGHEILDSVIMNGTAIDVINPAMLTARGIVLNRA
jgi:two-component system chemotaxis sensor kinase CheA